MRVVRSPPAPLPVRTAQVRIGETICLLACTAGASLSLRRPSSLRRRLTFLRAIARMGHKGNRFTNLSSARQSFSARSLFLFLRLPTISEIKPENRKHAHKHKHTHTQKPAGKHIHTHANAKAKSTFRSTEWKRNRSKHS